MNRLMELVDYKWMKASIHACIHKQTNQLTKIHTYKPSITHIYNSNTHTHIPLNVLCVHMHRPMLLPMNLGIIFVSDVYSALPPNIDWLMDLWMDGLLD